MDLFSFIPSIMSTKLEKLIIFEKDKSTFFRHFASVMNPLSSLAVSSSIIYWERPRYFNFKVQLALRATINCLKSSEFTILLSLIFNSWRTLFIWPSSRYGGCIILTREFRLISPIGFLTDIKLLNLVPSLLI